MVHAVLSRLLQIRIEHFRDSSAAWMEAGEDGDYLDAMRKANIKGALVGVEAVTLEGLKAVFKDWNCSGAALANRLQTFRQHGVHVLGSFIFGLPTDKRGESLRCNLI